MDRNKKNKRIIEANKQESENKSSHDAHYTELRRSKRSPVKPRRYEHEDLNSSIRINNKLKAKYKTTRECFEPKTKDNEFGTKPPEGINLISTLRRSKRSPRKTFQSEYIKSTSQIKNKQNSEAKPATKVNRDCFAKTGNDDTTSRENSQRKERKENEANQCESQSKETPVTNSKFKKSPLKITKEHKKNCLRGIKQIINPTAEELAEYKRNEREQIKANRKIKAIYENLVQVPEKVKILLLNNMSSEEILNTFPRYKDQLDIVFLELRSKPKVHDYNGINHYSVIELIDDEKQLKMMQKLGEVYETEPDGISLYPTLFANALMPEWLVHIFKDKYKFSHSEAVTHLNKQRQYMQYLDVEDYH